MEGLSKKQAGMAIDALTDRQVRERRYYDAFVQLSVPGIVSLESIRGKERRPWNPYWYVAELVREQYMNKPQQLLDFGCGPGSYSVAFAHLGYEVSGFDISEGNIRAAQALAERYSVADRTHFQVSTAEQLDYPSSFFDLIVGIDILHHVEISRAIPECLRVLKPGGVAIFKEPIEVPLFDRLRNTRLGRALRPKDVSFERHITEDERKLTASDLALIKAACHAEERRFSFISRFETLIFGVAGHTWLTATGASRLEMLDQFLLRTCPPLRIFGGSVVMTCHHRRNGAARRDSARPLRSIE
jgi:2-polyprenyl-3-methyl-5-hydroxy-6-metoxy-1,4-benzoquinol methylase